MATKKRRPSKSRPRRRRAPKMHAGRLLFKFATRHPMPILVIIAAVALTVLTGCGSVTGATSDGPDLSQPQCDGIEAGTPRSYACYSVDKYGWERATGWACTDRLVDALSGWDPAARNPANGATGLGQITPAQLAAGGYYAENYARSYKDQLDWTMERVERRYGTRTREMRARANGTDYAPDPDRPEAPCIALRRLHATGTY